MARPIRYNGAEDFTNASDEIILLTIHEGEQVDITASGNRRLDVSRWVGEQHGTEIEVKPGETVRVVR